ncbi:MAG: MFS transporter [Caulobacteraceae bacterium]|nr:MFS transporter [Caulobacteraceae bacterium]
MSQAASASPVGADIAARLDALPSKIAWRLIALVSLGGCFEFYDLMMTAYVSPGLVQAGVFHVGKAGLFGQGDQAAFASATFLGLFLGTVLFARVADRFGRRAIFTFSLVWYAAATAAMAFANTALEIDAWRLLSGVGIGIELVTIDAYVGELAPARLRGSAFAVNQSIQFLAVPIVAALSWLLLPQAPLGLAGWRWVMLIGASGALAVWLIRRALPESPRWLARQGRLAEASAVLDRLEGRPTPPTPPAHAQPAPGKRKDRDLLAEAFRPPYARRTAMLVVFNIFQAIGFYGFGNWAPTLIAAQGHSVVKSLGYSAAIALSFPLGPLLCAPLADRFERKTLIIAAAACTAGLGLAFSGQKAPAAIIALGVALTVSNNLLSFSYHAYQTELYPTRIRASAVGFVYAWSRLSTVVSSFAIAALLSGFGPAGVFSFIAAAMAIVIGAVGLFGPRTARLSLEEVSS